MGNKTFGLVAILGSIVFLILLGMYLIPRIFPS
jgi:hypothetical protein